MFVSRKKYDELTVELDALKDEMYDAYAIIGVMNAERAAQPSALNVRLHELWSRRPEAWVEDDDLEDTPEIPEFDGARDVLAALTIRANEG